MRRNCAQRRLGKGMKRLGECRKPLVGNPPRGQQLVEYSPSSAYGRRKGQVMAIGKGVVTGHFIAHWGVPNELYPRYARGSREFAILEFAPRPPRTKWRYATNGMSSYIQPHPDGNIHVRTELYASSSRRAEWILDLLTAMASYPIDVGTFFAEGDTIDVGGPIDQNTSCFTGILLAPPVPLSLGVVGGLVEKILVHQVVGLVQAEIDFAAGHEGAGALIWKKLITKGELPLDEVRSSVI